MEFIIFSNRGKREKNEDYANCARYEEDYCFVIADGLGGHGGGEVASRIAVDSVCKKFSETGFSSCFFEKALTEAQELIVSEQNKLYSYSDMKTTIVILVISKNKIYWSHIGDSRLYYFKNCKIKTRTLDHSVPQVMANSKQIKESEIRNHPDRSRLLHVLGVKGEEIHFDTSRPTTVRGLQAILLCTDGYWELIEDHEMEECLKRSNSPKEWITKMNMIIEDRGANVNMDNYTALAIMLHNKNVLGWLG